MEFDWDDENIAHVEEHGVEPVDAEEAFLDEWAVAVGAHKGPNGEHRTAYVGANSKSLLLFVVVTERNGKVRVATARKAEDDERDQYWR